MPRIRSTSARTADDAVAVSARIGVRGKAERARMEAVDCPQCAAFFAGLDLSPGAMRRCQADCSRHRVQHQAAPGTQSSYWDMSFPEDRSDGGGTPR